MMRVECLGEVVWEEVKCGVVWYGVGGYGGLKCEAEGAGCN